MSGSEFFVERIGLTVPTAVDNLANAGSQTFIPFEPRIAKWLFHNISNGFSKRRSIGAPLVAFLNAAAASGALNE